MKPGMQRDLVVAFWFLFDEVVADSDKPALPPSDTEQPKPEPAKERPPRRKNGRN